MKDTYKSTFISALHEAYALLKNDYDITCKRCNKKINAVEMTTMGHHCITNNDEADLLITCKKCGEIIWDNYKYTEIGNYHLNNNNECKKDEISNN